MICPPVDGAMSRVCVCVFAKKPCSSRVALRQQLVDAEPLFLFFFFPFFFCFTLFAIPSKKSRVHDTVEPRTS